MLGIEVYKDIVQVNHVKRTGSSTDHRLAFPPIYAGEVQRNKNYILVDDTLTLGGTLAALRGYIENRGGNVLGCMVMSAHPYSLDLVPTKEMLDNIKPKHDSVMDDYLNGEFNYDTKYLTRAEAAHILTAKNVDSLRDRITQARFSASIGVGGAEIGGYGVGKIEGDTYRELAPITAKLKERDQKAHLRVTKPTALCKGRVLFETENFIVQQVADDSHFYQAHRKSDLEQIPEVGQKARISYHQGKPLARVSIGGRSRSL